MTLARRLHSATCGTTNPAQAASELLRACGDASSEEIAIALTGLWRSGELKAEWAESIAATLHRAVADDANDAELTSLTAQVAGLEREVSALGDAQRKHAALAIELAASERELVSQRRRVDSQRARRDEAAALRTLVITELRQLEHV